MPDYLYALDYYASCCASWWNSRLSKLYKQIYRIDVFPGGKICFDAFIVLSVWFLIDQSFKIEHFFRTWILTLFYSITFAVVAFELGGIKYPHGA